MIICEPLLVHCGLLFLQYAFSSLRHPVLSFARFWQFWLQSAVCALAHSSPLNYFSFKLIEKEKVWNFIQQSAWMKNNLREMSGRVRIRQTGVRIAKIWQRTGLDAEDSRRHIEGKANRKRLIEVRKLSITVFKSKFSFKIKLILLERFS